MEFTVARTRETIMDKTTRNDQRRTSQKTAPTSAKPKHFVVINGRIRRKSA